MIEKIYTPLPKNSWKDAPRSKRCQWVKNIFIKHPKMFNAITAIYRKEERCRLTGQGDGIFILGQPGSGKTRLIKHLYDSYEILPEDQSSDVTLRPVISVKIPDTCTRKQVMIEIHEALGSDTHGNFHELMKRAITLFKSCVVQIVLIDDLQDIPARRSLRGVHDIAICIRELIDSTNALFVLCGNKDALVVLDSDLQLRKRIPFRLSLHYFDLSNAVHRPEFVRLMHVLDTWIPLAQESCITNPSVIDRMFFASGGIFQYIIQILDLAWPIALDNQRESICISDLEEAFVLLYGEVGSFINPFSSNFEKRILNKIGEPFHEWI